MFGHCGCSLPGFLCLVLVVLCLVVLFFNYAGLVDKGGLVTVQVYNLVVVCSHLFTFFS